MCTGLTWPLVFVNNHTAVWGSWYDKLSGSWGYACCHSTVHLSYCAGDAGKEAIQASSAQHLLTSTSTFQESDAKASDSGGRSEKVEQNYSKKRVGEGDVKLDQDRLTQAIQEERKRKSGGRDEDERFTKKQKSGFEVGTHDVTEEELGMFCLTYKVYGLSRSFHRGIPNDPSDARGPHGKLRRCRSLALAFLILLLYSMYK